MIDKTGLASVFADIVGAGNVKIDEPMKNHTSFKVGGPADLFVTPDSAENLAKLYSMCLQKGIPVFIMGNGTNLIVRDKGIRGVVLQVFKNLDSASIEGCKITAEAGILVSRLSRLALENGLEGLEFAEGIPGTLGGAVTMNAGAYISDMSHIVTRTEYMDRNGEIKVLEGEQHQFGKRSSIIQSNGGIVLSSELQLKAGDKAEIEGRMDEFKRQRKEKQPLELPSAGSVFKRPEGYFAGKLVQDCGLRGFRIGGAEVSCKHCGFIVNIDNATAGDVIELIHHIQAAVKEKFGVELQTEVRIVGEA